MDKLAGNEVPVFPRKFGCPICGASAGAIESHYQNGACLLCRECRSVFARDKKCEVTHEARERR